MSRRELLLPIVLAWLLLASSIAAGIVSGFAISHVLAATSRAAVELGTAPGTPRYENARRQPEAPIPVVASPPASQRPGALVRSRRVQAFVVGIASWYDAPHRTAAAGPDLRAFLGGWHGTVYVVGPAGRVGVRLVTTCQCYGQRLIDLSRDAFLAVCGPLGFGLCGVQVYQ